MKFLKFVLSVFVMFLFTNETFAQPKANFSVSDTSICAGSSTVFTDSSTGNINSWSWFFPGGSPANASGQGPHTVTYNSVGTYDQRLIVSGPQGQDTLDRFDYVEAAAPQTASFASSPTVCQSGITGVTDITFSGETYLWSVTGGNLVFDDSSSSIAVFWTTSGNQNVNVTMIEANGCSSSYNIPTTVVAGGFALNFTQEPATPICVSGPETFTVNHTAGNVYSWSIIGDGVITSGHGTNSIQVQFSSEGSSTVVADVFNTNSGCSQLAFSSRQTILPPQGSITGPSIVCDGQPQSYTLSSPDSNYAIAWSANGGNVVSGQNTNTVSIDWTIASGTGILTATLADNATSCSSEVHDTVDVNATFNIILDVLGDSQVCPGETDTILADDQSYFSYNWSNGATTSSILAGAGQYYCQVVNVAGCIGNSDTVSIIQLPGPPASIIQGPATACELAAPVLYRVANFNPSNQYNWSVTNGSFNGGNFVDSVTAQFFIGGTALIIVQTIDQNLCSRFDTVSVNVSAKLQPILAGADTVCDGEQVSFNISNDAAGSYSWSVDSGQVVSGNGTSSAVIILTGVGTQTISATKTDTVGTCGAFPAQLTIVVNPTPQLAITVVGGNTLCVGDTTGLVAPPGLDSYLWNTGATTQTIFISQPGDYFVQGTLNGCTGFSDTVATSIDTVQSVSLNGPLSVCEFTDSVVYGVNVDTSQFDVSWTASGITDISTLLGPTTTIDWGGIGNGVITVTQISRTTGCSLVDSFSVNISAGLAPVISGPSLVCSGETIMLDGGSGFANYNWSTGDNTQTISVAAGGVFTLTVSDNAGCSGDTSHTVVFGIKPTVTLSVTDESCSQVNGTATAVAVGGTTPYSYNWSNGSILSSLTGLTAGVYSVTVTDSIGCTDVETDTILNTPVPQLSVSVADNICFGEAGGSIDLTVNSGTPPFMYVWFGPDSFSSNDQDPSQLVNGQYSVTVTDAVNCSATTSAQISSPDSFNISTASMNTNCPGGNDGSASIAVSGASPPYSYLWSNGVTQSSISNLSAGSYPVTISDALGCTETVFVNVEEPDLLLVSDSSVEATCSSPGASILLVTGGTQPYSYLWSTGQTTGTINNLIAGTYLATVTDANGCSATHSVTISSLDGVFITQVTSVDVSCPAAGDGTITLDVTSPAPPITFSWSNGSTDQNLIGLSGGTYNVTATDSNGCIATAVVIVDEPAQIVISTQQIIPCFQQQIGEISTDVAGGTPPYTYLWSTGDTTGNISGLGQGIYIVSVTDANGCGLLHRDTLLWNPQINGSANIQHVSCYGGSDGSVSVNVSGGTPPFSYVWTNGATSASIVGVGAGTYGVTATDVNNCTFTGNINILEPDSISFSNGTATDEICDGSNGSVSVIVTGGTAPYSYSWNNGSTQGNLTGVPAGIYDLVVTDNGGCSATYSDSIGNVLGPAMDLVATNPLCFGDNNGTIDLQLSAGTPAFSYAWSHGPTTQDVGSLGPGLYTVVVTDGNGCVDSNSATVIEPLELSLNLTAQIVSCHSGSNGSVDLFASGGTTPYTFLWNTGATTEDISGLSAGNYTVSVTDSNGCGKLNSVAVQQPPPLGGSTSVVDVVCHGDSSGSATVQPSGGISPYTFVWSTGDSTSTINNLLAGSYSVTVTDVEGCTLTTSVTILQSSAITGNTNSTSSSCGLANGSAGVISISGGQPPYSYLWSTGSTNTTIAGIASGTYEVTVTDSLNCELILSETVGGSSLTNLSMIITNPSCATSSNGSINLVVSGGTPPWTYFWSDSTATQDLQGVPAGAYSVTVTDNLGCVATADTTLVAPPPVVGDSISINSAVSCFGGSNGSLTVFASGGNPPYTYNWSSGANSQTASGLTVGVYTVTITDAIGCAGQATETAPGPAELQTILIATNISCGGALDGEITTAISGGTPPYTFAWSNGATTQDLNGVGVGTYGVTITDNNGCTHSDSESVAATGVMVLTDSTIDASCGLQNGLAMVLVSGGAPPYTFNWNNGVTSSINSNLVGGTYTVTVDDASGCSEVDTMVVGDSPGVNIQVISQSISCNGGNDGFIDLTVTGGSQPYSYAWNSGASTQDLSNLGVPGNYQVTVTDASGCSSSQTVPITEPPALGGTLSPSPESCSGGLDGAVDLTPSGGTPPYTFVWSSGSTNEDINGLAAGGYTVTVTDANGCTFTGSAIVSGGGSLVYNIVSQDATCGGCTDGAAQVNVTSGTPPITYSWSNGSTNSSATNLGAGTYYVTITDNSGCSATDSVQVFEQATDYCTSQGQSVAQGILRTFCVGPTCHQSANDNGYGDYTFLNGRINRGSTVPITMVAFAGGPAPGPFHWKIWLDANQDKDFNDANELLFETTQASSDTVFGTMTVPFASLTGPTRLRVSMGDAITGPCDNPAFGEVQDYTIIVSSPYCGSVGASTAQSWISSFCVNVVCVNSGNNNGYRFVNTSQNLQAGQIFPGVFVPGYSGAPVPVYWKIYLDANRDGDYQDTNEEIFSAGPAADTTFGNFQIPFEALNGRTRIRFMMSQNPITGACDPMTAGEVEDFGIDIFGGQTTKMLDEGNVPYQYDENPELQFSLYPNPADHVLQLQFDGGTERVLTQLNIFNINGELILSKSYNEVNEGETDRIDVGELSNGIYSVSVETEHGISVKKLVIAR